MRSFAVAIFAAVLAATGTGETNGGVYTFEGLSEGDLLGQDNWEQYASQGTSWSVVEPGGGSNNTAVAEPGDNTHLLIRQNDSSFAFPTHSASGTAAVMQFDFRYAEVSDESHYYFGLGADSTDDADDKVSTVKERGPAIGMFDSDGSQEGFGIRLLAVNGTPIYSYGYGTDTDDGDWIRLRLVMDFTANGGDGEGLLYYKNLTDGDPGFTALNPSTPQDLKLTEMNPGVSPSTWDTMVIVRSGESGAGDNQPQIDNLHPNVLRGPEPSALVALCGLGLTCLGLCWRRRGRVV